MSKHGYNMISRGAKRHSADVTTYQHDSKLFAEGVRYLYELRCEIVMCLAEYDYARGM